MTVTNKPPQPRVVEFWNFDGSERSIRAALDKYPELKFVWRGGGESFVSWRKGNKLIPLRQGKPIVRLSDGSFSRRTEATLIRLGVRPGTPAAVKKPPPTETGVMVAAWVFDGTEESVRGALDTHRSLHFVQHQGGNYLLWDKGGFRYRVKEGQCLAELANGELAHRRIRTARQAGLLG